MGFRRVSVFGSIAVFIIGFYDAPYGVEPWFTSRHHSDKRDSIGEK
jgi:hypothetical protein